jgi:hypothetical protein
MYRLWSEWDIGEGNKIFATPEAGEAWLAENPHVVKLAAEEQLTVDEYIDTCFNDWGYFGWETLEIIGC